MSTTLTRLPGEDPSEDVSSPRLSRLARAFSFLSGASVSTAKTASERTAPAADLAPLASTEGAQAAAGSGADLQMRRVGVIRVFRNHQNVQIGFQLFN